MTLTTLQTAEVFIAIFALLILSVTITLMLKNHEIKKLKKSYECEVNNLKKAHETLAESSSKMVRTTEENYNRKLHEKDEQIEDLIKELEGMKSWKEEVKVMMAKFEGASQGNVERMIFKLLEYNQNLNRTLNDKWAQVEKDICKELSHGIERLKAMFADAENLHRDSIEIISEYESRLPEDFKRKVHEELLKLPEKQ